MEYGRRRLDYGRRPQMAKAWYSFRLMCGHNLEKNLELYEVNSLTVYCYKCRDAVQSVQCRGQYRFSCLADNCHSGRKFGRALIQCQMFADKHMRKHPTHPCVLWEGHKRLEVRPAKRNVNELPFGLDNGAPPY